MGIEDYEMEMCRQSLRRAAEGDVPLWPMRTAKFLLDLDERLRKLEAEIEEGKRRT